MNKKLKIGIAIAVAAVILAAVTGILLLPQDAFRSEDAIVTVSYTNPRYSTMQVEITVRTEETVGGFDMTLLYNTAKWELVEDSVKTGSNSITAIVEKGQIRLVCENSDNRPLKETVVTLTMEMWHKVEDDPLGLRLEVAELYRRDNKMTDIEYAVDYLEET